MAGLASVTKPAAAPAPEAEEPEGNVTPEEQAMYEQVVNNALEIIYPKGDEAIAPQIRDALTAGEQPVMNLAMASVSIVTGLVASAKQAGQKIPGEILFHAGAQIVELVAEAAEAFKIAEYSEEDIERALYLAVDMYREQAKASGDLDEEAMKADFAELQAADAEGRFDEVVPGAREHAEKIMARDGQAPVEGEEAA